MIGRGICRPSRRRAAGTDNRLLPHHISGSSRTYHIGVPSKKHKTESTKSKVLLTGNAFVRVRTAFREADSEILAVLELVGQI